MSVDNKLYELLQAKDSLIYAVTYEENRLINKVCEALYRVSLGSPHNWEVYVYSFASGLYEVDIEDRQRISKAKLVANLRNPMEVFKIIRDRQNDEANPILPLKTNAVFIFKDLPLLFHDPSVVRMLRDLKENYREKVYCPIIITSPVLNLPPPLAKIFTVYELPLLTSKEIYAWLEVFFVKLGLPLAKMEAIVQACTGLTEREISRALLHSLTKHHKGTIEAEDIYEEKIAILRQQGLLDFILPQHSLEGMGGCSNFKKWLEKLKYTFTKEAREAGIPQPKGALLVGLPGTSKSMSAEILANYLDIPLVALNMSKIMGSLVGESERNIARALEIAKAVAPCVLLIDEVEKLLGGINSSNSCDGGALARVMAQLLQFLHSDGTEVITIMTSNDVSQLPPELTRTGRLDGIWFFDLPTAAERQQILAIYCRQYGLTLSDASLELLLEKTENFTGAELQQVVKNLKTEVYVRQQQEGASLADEPLPMDIAAAVNGVVPVYKANWEQLNAFRSEAAEKYLKASGEHTPVRKPTMLFKKEG